MSSRSAIVLAALSAVVVLSFAATLYVWRECRAEGHSLLYCVALVSR